MFGFELGGHGISIHAPVKGATLSDMCKERMDKISIHAPVKGATSMSNDMGIRLEFQSTLP